MNKFMLFMIIVAWLLVATFFVDAFESFDAGNFTVSNPVADPDIGNGGPLEQIWSMLKTFISILSFNVAGLPKIIVVLLFQVPTFGLLYMLIDIIKDLIPFT